MKSDVTPQYYVRVHYWLRQQFGKANKCEFATCNKKSIAFQWAKIKGLKYEFKRENYLMLCKSCHTAYDWTEEGRKVIAEQNKKIVEITCRVCHVSFVANIHTKACDACNVISAKRRKWEWRMKNPDRDKQVHADWKKNNLERFLAYRREYDRKKRELLRAKKLLK